MDVLLGQNNYGKAEVRLLRVERDATSHQVTDLSVHTELSGEMRATYLTGDNASVLPTDTQKNVVLAFAKRHGVGQVEDFAHRLATHFVTTQSTVHRARVTVEQHGWSRVTVDGRPAPHAFTHSGSEVRFTQVTSLGWRTWTVSGIDGLRVLKTTGSRFRGFLRDEYTTLPDADDRLLATRISARWLYLRGDVDWAASHQQARRHLVEAFADTDTGSLQQTLYEMGRRVLTHRPEIGEVRLWLPNQHCVAADLTPFGLDNDDEVLVPLDRPYGLIHGSVVREGCPVADQAW